MFKWREVKREPEPPTLAVVYALAVSVGELRAEVWKLKSPYGAVIRKSGWIGEIIFQQDIHNKVLLVETDNPVDYSVIRKGNIFYVLLTYEKDNKKVSEVYAVIGDKAELTTEYPDFNKPDMKGTL
jgi:hypothetical protein